MADDLARLGQRRVIRSESLDPSTAPARFHHTAPEAFPVMQRQPTVATVVSAPEPIFSTPFSGGLPLQSVVKILVVATAPNYFMPWQMLQQQEFGGTGFVLSGRRIITNAHVVQNHSIVRIKKYNSADLFPAKVTCMANICDLALLTVDDDSFWEGIPELKLADLPQLYEDIMVIGYPIGGDNICVTRGIVSRIDTLPYSTRNIDNVPELLVVQIDAAINHGNSGGPACNQHGDVVGVAFCGMVKASNIGYVIPLPVIATFLQQVAEAGVFTGICELGLAYQEMMNHSIRERFQMRASHSGVLVSEIAPLAAVKDFIQKNDVILSVDGVDIANDGTVVFGEGGLRLRFGVLITSKSRGEIVNFKLLRDGQEVSVDVKMGPVPRLLPTFHGFDAQPSYIVVGGLVFVSLNIPLINQIIARLSAGGTTFPSAVSVPFLYCFSAISVLSLSFRFSFSVCHLAPFSSVSVPFHAVSLLFHAIFITAYR
eukprot:TRINITY_DN8444_c0_g2_i1.p1 TRINITY_DN8444_c0_g2~~TRINITY_DN8444_c0_g2_i1.p1  ORF type:complete len:484 (-),score=93.08 TRINITY_DN8444_c0_g2_i1:536-1987(-)